MKSTLTLKSAAVGAKALFIAMAISSALLCIVAAATQVGYESSFGVQDSAGNSAGFLQPVTRELFFIFLHNCTVAGIAENLGWYGAVYLVVHLLAILYLVFASSRSVFGVAAVGCWLQPVLFPTGVLGLFLLPHFLTAFFAGKVDGEMISEMPFWMTFQPFWIVSAFVFGFFFWALHSWLSLAPRIMPDIHVQKHA